VTDRPCPIDDVPLRDAEVVCSGCVGRTRGDLRALPDAADGTAGLLRELDTQLSQQTAMPSHGTGTDCPQGCLHGPDDPDCTQGVRLDYGKGASDALTAILTLLHTQVRVWDEEHPLPDPIEGPACPVLTWEVHPSCWHIKDIRVQGTCRRADLSDPRRQALRLAEVFTGREPWAAELVREVRDAVSEAERAIDRPADVGIVGRCQQCGTSVYAAQDAAVVRCRGCGQRAAREDVREASLAEARGLLPAADLARVLDVDPARVRQWASRGRLVRRRYDADGRPLYRIADGARLAQRATSDDEEETT